MWKQIYLHRNTKVLYRSSIVLCLSRHLTSYLVRKEATKTIYLASGFGFGFGFGGKGPVSGGKKKEGRETYGMSIW